MMAWEWKRFYIFSIGLILLRDAVGFSVWNKASAIDWQTGGSVVSSDQPHPPLQNFDTTRNQPFGLALTNTVNANSEWSELESNSHMPIQTAPHGSISNRASSTSNEPVLNVQNQYAHPLMQHGSFETLPSRPYWYASSSWKPSNCELSASQSSAGIQDVPRPTAPSQSSGNELASTYQQNSYGAQISGASRWYTLQGQGHQSQASAYQSTQIQPNKSVPQSSWSLTNQYPATSMNQGSYGAQPTGPSSWYTSSGRLGVPSPPQSQSMSSVYTLGSLTRPTNQPMTPSQTSTSESSVASQGQGRYVAQSPAASGFYDALSSSRYSLSEGHMTPPLFTKPEDTPAQVPEVQSQPLNEPTFPTQSLVSKSYSRIRAGAKWYRVDPLRLQLLQFHPSQGSGSYNQAVSSSLSPISASLSSSRFVSQTQSDPTSNVALTQSGVQPSSRFSTVFQNAANPIVPVSQAPQRAQSLIEQRTPNVLASLNQISPGLVASSRESLSAAWPAQSPGFYTATPSDGASSWQAPGQYQPVPQSVVSAKTLWPVQPN